AVTTTSTTYCWGFNRSGELGDGTTDSSAVPVALFGGGRYTSVAAGGEVSCGIASDGTGHCWGDHELGQLGTGSTTGPESCVAPNSFSYSCSTKPTDITGGFTFSQVSVGEWTTCGR